MRKMYDGLEAVRVPVTGSDILTNGSQKCIGTIMNVIEDGRCISDPKDQYIEYYTPEDPGWE